MDSSLSHYHSEESDSVRLGVTQPKLHISGQSQEASGDSPPYLISSRAMAYTGFMKSSCLQFTLLSYSVRGKPGRRWFSKYFLTTPIFYVNADPHVGHLYTALMGDAAVRFQKLKNPDLTTKFMTGTDDHGLKVSKAAKDLNMDVLCFCDKVSNKYRSLFDLFNINGDDFLRTTQERHLKSVTALWNKIHSKGLIYKKEYSGWYCVSDEMFVSEIYLEPEVSENGVRYTSEGKKPVHYVSEDNYKFQLSKFQDDLLYWLKDEIVKPKKFQDILVQWIKEEEMMQDVSISRPVERVPWGIPVPGDASQSIYVWLDALSSYLTTNGYPNSSFKWPPDLQIIGKDILKFHGIYWPAFLMAADLEPPKSILCHSHWLKDGEKMSKSKGNIVNPFEQAQTYTSEGFRFFLLREGVPHSDGNFTDVRVTDVLNSELADTLGNLLNRCTGVSLNPNQIFPPFSEEAHTKYCVETAETLIRCLEELPGLVETYFEEFSFYKGIDHIFIALHLANKYFDSEKPWILRKSPHTENHLNYVLHLTMESLRVCGILLQPIIPKISRSLLDKLSIDSRKRNLKDVRPFSWELTKGSDGWDLMTDKVILFQRLAKG